MDRQNYLVKSWLVARSRGNTDQKMRQVMSLSLDENEACEAAEERLEREFGRAYSIDFDIVPIGQATLDDVRGGALWTMEDAT